MNKTSFIKLILTITTASFIFVSCSKDENYALESTNENGSEQTQQPKAINSEDVVLSLKVDNAIDAVSNLSLGFENNFKNVTSPNLVHDCMDYKVEKEEGVRKVVITFDEEGCEIYGHVYKGKISYSYKYDKESKSYEMTKSFEGFSIDDRKFEGTMTSKIQYKGGEENPKCEYSIDLTITLEDGKTVTRKGVMLKEWTEGSDTHTHKDDVFTTTGDWVTTFADGTSHSYKITKPLRFIGTCAYYVSGTVEINNEETKGTLDYGDDECDNKATFTNSDGEVIEIEL